MSRVFKLFLRTVLPAVLLCLSVSGAPALDADEMFADPAQEARARELGRQLRCLKCRNQSIFDSNAGIAKDLRVAVRERMQAGDSDEEILTYVSDRFGDYVLLKPRLSRQTYLLWFAPVALMLMGGAALWGYHRSRAATPAADALSDAERAEAQRILGKGGR